MHNAWGLKHNDDVSSRIAGALACAFMWALGATVYAEAKGKSALWGIGLGIFGTIAIGILFLYARQLDLVEYALFGALILLVGLAPYLTRRTDNLAFWSWNHDVWFGAAFAVLAGILVGLGAVAIFATLEYLFKLDTHHSVYESVGIVAVVLVGPLYFLNALPRRFDLKITEGTLVESDLSTRMISTIARRGPETAAWWWRTHCIAADLWQRLKPTVRHLDVWQHLTVRVVRSYQHDILDRDAD